MSGLLRVSRSEEQGSFDKHDERMGLVHNGYMGDNEHPDGEGATAKARVIATAIL
jgi:hypothetical protein